MISLGFPSLPCSLRSRALPLRPPYSPAPSAPPVPLSQIMVPSVIVELFGMMTMPSRM